MKLTLLRTNVILLLITIVLIPLIITEGTTAAAAPPWNSNFYSYAVGDVVSYEGAEYRCLQTHRSQPDWTPSTTPSLWLHLGGSTPTTTNVPTATKTPTTTPNTPTPTKPPTTRTPTNPTQTPTTAPPSNGRKLIGYFVEWGVYDRNYHVKNIKTSGSAAKLTHINYAFGNVVNSRCQVGDSYADFEKTYSATDSVDGVADTWDQPLRGSFNQLRKLKAQYPHLKVLISLGGWTWSSGFSDAALPQNREAFVRSCIDLYIKDSRWSGLFDGIDIDWEYPGACGNTCNFRPEDTQNFTALLAEFRRQLNAVRSDLLLTIAAPAGQEKISKIEVNNIHRYLDFINLMTYDFHGAWETTTNFNSPLYQATGNPARNVKFTTDEATQTWLNRGTPANKLVVGVPFYGRGWQGVGSSNNGLWQSGTSGAPGKYETGIEDYKILKTKGYSRYFNSEAQNAWLYSNGFFWTYDDAPVMTAKMNYIRTKNLAGVMLWELSGDTTNGELITTLHNNR